MTDMAEFNSALAFQAALVTERAAIAAHDVTGLGDEAAADKAAVRAMHAALSELNIQGHVVIGEGERDEASKLYVGEKLGAGNGPEIDIALDPLEGTTLTAKSMANALSVIAFAPKGGLLYVPDAYMEKIAVGPGYPEGIIDLDNAPTDNVRAVAKHKGVKPEHITVCVMDRARHSKLIGQLRDLGCRVALISDGDIQGVINTTDASTGIDLYLGSGGAPEGVLAAAALKCTGGQMQGRLTFRNDEEVARARRAGIDDLSAKYDLSGLASGPTIFCATGVTAGSLLDGVRYHGGFVSTESLVMNSIDRTVSRLRSRRPSQ